VHEFSERPITLQEVLRQHGYRIHLLLSGDHTIFYGLKDAYGHVDSYFDGHDASAARYVNDDALLLDRLAAFPAADGTPVMLQLHLMSAHPLGKRHDDWARFQPAASYAIRHGEPSERATNFYDNGVLQADGIIDQALRELGRKGYLDDALVVITGDHGEALGEHGLFQHANSVHEEVLRVPLVLLAYGKARASLAQARFVSQTDIAPTLLESLGIPLPPTWRGIALRDAKPRDFAAFQERWEIGLYDLRDSQRVWKYWLNLRTGEEYAFDLDRDPKERENVVATAPAALRHDWRRRVLADTTVTAKLRFGQDTDPDQ